MSGIEFEDNGTDDLQIDLSAVTARAGFEVIPKGNYNFVVEKAEGKRSEANNAMISLQLEIEDGDYVGKKLFTHVVFSPKAIAGAKATMIALGLGDLANSPGFKPLDPATADAFVGARGVAVVTIDKYEGEDSNKVKRIKATGAGGDGFHN